MPEFAHPRNELARKRVISEKAYASREPEIHDLFVRNKPQSSGVGYNQINAYKKRQNVPHIAEKNANAISKGQKKRFTFHLMRSLPPCMLSLSGKKTRPTEIKRQKVNKHILMKTSLQRSAKLSYSRVTPSEPDSATLIGNFTSNRSCKSYSLDTLPAYSLKSIHKCYFNTCPPSLSLYGKTATSEIKEKINKERNALGKVSTKSKKHISQNSTFLPIKCEINNVKPYMYKRQRLHKIQSGRHAHYSPYAKTVFVYTALDQKPKRKPSIGSNASFNIKFYRSMGDGRPMYGNIAPNAPIPRNYSPTNMVRMGRDEDGCICVIPQDPGNDRRGCFLKRYFRVLLKEQKRCLCGKTRPKAKPCSYGNCRPDYDPDSDNQFYGRYRYNNAIDSFRGNDVSCQCKHKERFQRSDRDTFYRDRGTTCIPTCPSKSNPDNTENVANAQNALNAQNKGMPDKNAVNIGSNFSFQVGLYRRWYDNHPPAIVNQGYSSFNMPVYAPNSQYMQPGVNDCVCDYSKEHAYHNRRSESILSELLKSREPKSKSSSYSGSQYNSNAMINCQPDAPLRSPSSRSWSSFIKSQFERNDLCCNNEPKSRCLPKKNKAVRCRCDKKPVLVGCSDKKSSVGILCSRTTANFSTSTSQKMGKPTKIGCTCVNEPILAQCTKKKKICCQCNGKKTRKKGGCCCCNDEPKFSLVRTMSALLKRESEDVCCRCGKSKTRENPNANASKCCCCKTSETKQSGIARLVGRPVSRLLQMISKKCNLSKESDCKCSSKSGEFDYKKALKRLNQPKGQPCPCGESIVRKIFSSQLVPPEPKQLTKAQQCGCKEDYDFKKKFGRLLLYNTVQKPICCSSITYDQNSRSIGIGEDDYRKVPPMRPIRRTDGSEGDGFALRNFMSRFTKPEECCTRMHYSAFNPLNQSEAGVQHISRVGPDEIGKQTVCKNQAIECPKSKPLTAKDYENYASLCPGSQHDPNRKAVRLGSSCNFCLEFYKGMPPPKDPPSFAPKGPAPCPAPCAETTTNNTCPVREVCNPTRKANQQPIMTRAFSNLLLTQKKHMSSKLNKTCIQCNKCVKVPLIKKGFAHLILRDKKPVLNLNTRTCQKTNTLQPNRKVVVRKPAAGTAKGNLGRPRNCDPYVCLKRINERKCCD